MIFIGTHKPAFSFPIGLYSQLFEQRHTCASASVDGGGRVEGQVCADPLASGAGGTFSFFISVAHTFHPEGFMPWF